MFSTQHKCTKICSNVLIKKCLS